PTTLATLPDEELLELVQRQHFRLFWEGAHPVSYLAPDRRVDPARRESSPDHPPVGENAPEDLVATGGSGFAIMAFVVAVERGWISRAEALERLGAMLDLLMRATCYHGAFPHFMNGRTGATIPFWRKDDGGDLVETSFLCMGLLCARAYFNR